MTVYLLVKKNKCKYFIHFKNILFKILGDFFKSYIIRISIYIASEFSTLII